jgi:transposase
MTYSIDFRKKVLDIKEEHNLSYRETSARFGIGIDTIVRWKKRLEPKLTRDKPPTKINTNLLLQDVEAYPDAYYKERAERFGVSKVGIFHALKRLKISHKKNSQPSQSK